MLFETAKEGKEEGSKERWRGYKRKRRKERKGNERKGKIKGKERKEKKRVNEWH